MRYRIGETPGEGAVMLDQDAFTALAVLSLLIGVGFIFAGLRSRHYWMAIWGGGLALCSVIYLLYIALGPHAGT